jgi:hypothetical protein
MAEPSPEDLNFAIKTGNLQGVRALLEQGLDPNTEGRSEPGGRGPNTLPLWWAAYEGHCEIIQILLRYGADINKKGSSRGDCALIGAAMAGKLDAVRLLIESGAKRNVKSGGGLSLEATAMEGGFLDVVRYLRSLPPLPPPTRPRKVKPGIDSRQTPRSLVLAEAPPAIVSQELMRREGLTLAHATLFGQVPPRFSPAREAYAVIGFFGSEWTVVHALDALRAGKLPSMAERLSADSARRSILFIYGEDAEGMDFRVFEEGRGLVVISAAEGVVVPERTSGIEHVSADPFRMAQRVVRDLKAFVPALPDATFPAPEPPTTIKALADRASLGENLFRELRVLSELEEEGPH